MRSATAGIDLAEVVEGARELACADRLRLPAQLGEERLDLELAVAAAEAPRPPPRRRPRPWEPRAGVPSSRRRGPRAGRRRRRASRLGPRPRRARRRPERRDRRGRAAGRRALPSPRARRRPETTGVSDDVAVIATSAAASALLELVEPVRGGRRSASRPRAARSFVRFATATFAIPRPSAAFSVCKPIRPAPTTSTCLSRRSPSALSASASAIELAVAGFAPIAVSERARRPAEIAVRNRSFIPGPTVPAASPSSYASPTWPRISASPRTRESSPAATRLEVARDVLAGVHVEMVEQQLARDVVRVRERVDELVARIVDARGEPRVELDAVAGLQHRVLEDRRAALGAEPERADALAQLDGSRAMAEPEADETVHAAEILLAVDRRESRRCARSGSTSAGRSRMPCSSRTERARREGPDRRAPGGVGRRRRSCRRRDGRRAASRTGRRSRRTRSCSGAEREPRSSRTRASSTSCTCAGRRARTCTGRASSIRRRSSRSSAASACAGRTGADGELVPLDLDDAARARRRGDRGLAALLVSRPGAGAPRRRGASPPLSVGARRRVSRGRAGVPRVRARLDDGGRRVPGAGALALPRLARGTRAPRRGFPTPLVMRSSGGLATLDEAAAHAAFALLSGPAAGVVGAARIASLAGFENALSFDMGGTSTDVCAIVGRRGAARERAPRRRPARPPPDARRAHRRRRRRLGRLARRGRRAARRPRERGRRPGPCVLRQGRRRGRP